MQKTTIGGDTSEGGGAAVSRVGRLKQKIGEKKKKDLSSFLKSAQFSPGEGPEEGSIQIAGQNALQPGDSLRIWIDTATLMMRRVEIDTALEEKPVRVETTYQSIPGGPTYQAQAELAYLEKELEAIVENFDYEGGASAAQ